MSGQEVVHEIPDLIDDRTLDKVERYCEGMRHGALQYAGRSFDLISPRLVHAIILRLRDAEDQVIGYGNERGGTELPYPERITPVPSKK